MNQWIGVLLLCWASSCWMTAVACSCVGGTLEDGYRSAHKVLVGTALNEGNLMQDTYSSIWTQQYQYTFSVKTGLKATSPIEKTVLVYTGTDDGACGYPFGKGNTYILFLYESTICVDGQLQNAYTTSICTETTSYCDKTYQKVQQIAATVQQQACACPMLSRTPTVLCSVHEVDQAPTFNGGGAQAWLDYLSSRVTATPKAKVWWDVVGLRLTFIINKKGQVRAIHLPKLSLVDQQDPAYLQLYQELEKALHEAPPWTPAYCGGEPVPVRYSIYYPVCGSRPPRE